MVVNVVVEAGILVELNALLRIYATNLTVVSPIVRQHQSMAEAGFFLRRQIPQLSLASVHKCEDAQGLVPIFFCLAGILVQYAIISKAPA